MDKEKNWTGERLETHIFNNTTVAHLHRYAMAIPFIMGKTVLDIASGEGYGSNILSKYCKKIIGVDIDVDTIEKAKEKYKSNNLEFKVGKAELIPIDSDSIDVVISFETIEHHDKHQEMICEIKRVLKPDGILIISTPDKKNYSDGKDFKNPFHIKELYVEEFKELINSHFLITQYYFQTIFNGSLVLPEHNKNGFIYYEGDFDSLTSNSGFNAPYVICIASNLPLPPELSSGFLSKKIEIKEQKELIRRNRSEAREEAINWIKNSWNYKIGKILTIPIRIFKNQFQKN